MDPAGGGQYYAGTKVSSAVNVAANSVSATVARDLASSGSNYWVTSYGYIDSGNNYVNCATGTSLGNQATGYGMAVEYVFTHAAFTIPANARFAFRTIIGGGTPQTTHVTWCAPFTT